MKSQGLAPPSPRVGLVLQCLQDGGPVLPPRGENKTKINSKNRPARTIAKSEVGLWKAESFVACLPALFIAFPRFSSPHFGCSQTSFARTGPVLADLFANALRQGRQHARFAKAKLSPFGRPETGLSTRRSGLPLPQSRSLGFSTSLPPKGTDDGLAAACRQLALTPLGEEASPFFWKPRGES